MGVEELERRRSDVNDVLSTHQQVNVQVRRLITQDWSDAVLNYKTENSTESWTLMKKSLKELILSWRYSRTITIGFR